MNDYEPIPQPDPVEPELTHRYKGENLAICGAEVPDPCPDCYADVMRTTPSEREIEVARAFATGRTVEQIMAELSISRNTLYRHRSSLFALLGVGTMPEVWRVLGWLNVNRHPEPGETSDD